MSREVINWCVSKVLADYSYFTVDCDCSIDIDDGASILDPSFFQEYCKKYGYNYISSVIPGMISYLDEDNGVSSCYPFYIDTAYKIDKKLVQRVKRSANNLLDALVKFTDLDEDDEVSWVDVIRFKELSNGNLSLEFDTAVIGEDINVRASFVLDRRLFEEAEGTFVYNNAYVIDKKYLDEMSGINDSLDEYISSEVYEEAVACVCEMVYLLLRTYLAKYGSLNDIFDVMLYLNCVPPQNDSYKTGRFGISFGYEVSNSSPCGNFSNACISEEMFTAPDIDDVVTDDRFSKISGKHNALCFEDGVIAGIRLVGCI